MADSRDITGKNRKFTGTGGIKVPSGTEAQRVDEAGTFRFNTDTNLAEYYDGVDWKPIDAPPTITGFTLDGGASVTQTVIDNTAGGDATIVISGSNFDVTSGTVVFEPEGGGSNVTTQTITRTNSSQFTVTVTRTDFLEANDPYAIKLTNGSGLAATLASALDCNVPPAFDQASGTLATVVEGDTLTTEVDCSATDADGDTITYSITSGSLPGSGLTLNSSTGFVTGTLGGSPSVGDFTFTVQAATANGNSTRDFTIAVTAPATGGTRTECGGYYYHEFTSSGNFVVPCGVTLSSVEYLVVAGGAGGGSGCSAPNGSGGGGGAGGYINSSSSCVTGTTAITVGGGGNGGPACSNSTGSDGGNSSAFGSTATGGGGGGGTDINGRPGGSGGGAGGCISGASGGSGTACQGNRGGNATSPYSGGGDVGGGGGGANEAGGDAVNSPVPAGAIDGGDGRNFPGTWPTSFGESGYFSGGGAGNTCASPTPSQGGNGGGGNGMTPAPGRNAIDGTGGGGGGSGKISPFYPGGGAGGNGGDGVVLIRYQL